MIKNPFETPYSPSRDEFGEAEKEIEKAKRVAKNDANEPEEQEKAAIRHKKLSKKRDNLIDKDHGTALKVNKLRDEAKKAEEILKSDKYEREDQLKASIKHDKLARKIFKQLK